MKIGNPTGPAPTAAPATEQTAGASGVPRPAGEQPTTTTTTTAAVGGNDSSQVKLSSTATTMLAGSNAASADFDAEKVQRITQAIADGSFRIDAGAIADKLIANAEEVLRNGSATPGGRRPRPSCSALPCPVRHCGPPRRAGTPAAPGRSVGSTGPVRFSHLTRHHRRDAFAVH